tara:strand:- start:13884 stop:15446 length:1563 start_codon:yes stop_codon:yes gene_type:complete
MSIIEDISDFFKNILGFLKTIILLFIDKINPSSWSFIEENKEKRNVYSGLFIFTLSTLIIYFIYFIFKKAITLSRNNFLDSKYNLIFNILFLFFYISTLYFFIFRKKNDTSEDNYFNFIEKNNNKEFIFGINERNFNSNIFNEKILSPFKFIMLNLFALLFIGFFIAGFSNIFVSFLKDFSNSKNIIKSLILLSITITILMILAKIFSVTLSDTLCNNVKDDIFKQLLCIIKNFIFFIPCLLLILVEEIKNQFKITHPTIYIILILEILFILLLFLIPIIKDIFIDKDNRLLKPGEILYTNEYKELSSYQNLENLYNKKNSNLLLNKTNKYNIKYSNKLNISDYKEKNEKNYNYTIIFDLYLNPQGRNTAYSYNKETELFNYGNKPVILYNGKDQSIVIKSNTLNNDIKQMDTIIKIPANSLESDVYFKFQKWNTFKINYYDFKIEIILNNKIIAVKDSIPSFNNNDIVSIGEKDGIHGSIKDIYYYTFSNEYWENLNKSVSSNISDSTKNFYDSLKRIK